LSKGIQSIAHSHWVLLTLVTGLFICRLVQTLRLRRASASRGSGVPVLDKEDGLVLSPHVAAVSSRLHECVSGALSRLGVVHVNELEVGQQLNCPPK
jgi:hypothetical protein